MSLPQTVNQDALAISRIVAGLAALLGLTAGHAPGRIVPELRRIVLRLLRPAESAVRRLILILAQAIVLKPRQPPPCAVRTCAGHGKKARRELCAV